MDHQIIYLIYTVYMLPILETTTTIQKCIQQEKKIDLFFLGHAYA